MQTYAGRARSRALRVARGGARGPFSTGTWLGGPHPLRWTAWHDAGRALPLEVYGYEPVQPECRWTPLTLKESPPANEIAATSSVGIEVVRQLNAESSEWKRLLPTIERAVRPNQTQPPALNTRNLLFQKEVAAATDVLTAPLVVRSLYRAASDFEAERT